MNYLPDVLNNVSRHSDLEWSGRLVRTAGVQQGHTGHRRGDGAKQGNHRRRRRRDGRGGRTVGLDAKMTHVSTGRRISRLCRGKKFASLAQIDDR